MKNLNRTNEDFSESVSVGLIVRVMFLKRLTFRFFMFGAFYYTAFVQGTIEKTAFLTNIAEKTNFRILKRCM